MTTTPKQEGAMTDEHWDYERLDAAIQDFATVVIMAQRPDHGGMRRELKQTRERIHEIAKILAAQPSQAQARKAVAQWQTRVIISDERRGEWINTSPEGVATIREKHSAAYEIRALGVIQTSSPVASHNERDRLLAALERAGKAESALRALTDECDRVRRENEVLRQELKNIANADTVAWDDPTEYEAWAKSRARHALSQQKDG